MKLISNHHSDNHLNSISSLINGAEKIVVCIAFLKLSGLKLLCEKLKHKKGKCIFFIGTNFYQTEPDALLLIYEQGHEAYITKKEKITFHPKLYYFKNNETINIIIGSANITSGGLESNFEISSFVETFNNSEIDNDFNQIIKSFEAYSRPLNLKFIELYRINYKNYKFRHNAADVKFEDEKIDENDYDDEDNQEILSSTNNPNRNRNPNKFTDEDRMKFPKFLNQYKDYKLNVRPSGVVSKRDKEIYPELMNWYHKIKEIIHNGLLPYDIEKILREAGFPIEDGKLANSRVDWNKNFELLLKYKIDNNLDVYDDPFRIPQRKNPKHNDYFLGGWCARQKLRRNNKETPTWDWNYEENKMESVKYVWDVPALGGSEFDDEEWFENLKLLENYYKHNPTTIQKHIPDQKTKVGHWLNDQMTLKNVGRKNKKTGIITWLHPIREGYLNIILEENGIEWQWQIQKHSIEFEDFIKEINDFQKGDRNKIPSQGKDDITGLGRKYAQMKSALMPTTKKTLPQWKIDRLREEGIID